MAEFVKEEPAFVHMAMDQLHLSAEERKLVYDYGQALLLVAYASIDNPNSDGKCISFEKMKICADSKFPEGWALVEKVIEKANELEGNSLV
jgi:hypothetical protein